MLNQIEKLLIVVGCQRSGTTLLGQILGAPEDALLIDEDDGLYDWFTEFARTGSHARALLDDILGHAARKYRSNPASPGQNTRHAALDKSDIRYLVLKAPNLTYAFDDISRIGIPAAVIYIVRDPRSVVASMRLLSHVPMIENQTKLLEHRKSLASEFRQELSVLRDPIVSPITKCAVIWRIKSTLHDKFMSLGIPTHRLKYEDLIADAAETCRRLAHGLDIPFDPQMLSHEEVYQGTGPGRTVRSRSIDQDSVEAWRKTLDANDEQLVLDIAAPQMRTLGYEIT